jgi:hypothetical protein
MIIGWVAIQKKHVEKFWTETAEEVKVELKKNSSHKVSFIWTQFSQFILQTNTC